MRHVKETELQQPVSPTPDFEELSRNVALFVEAAGSAAAAYLKPIEERKSTPGAPSELGLGQSGY